MATQNQPVPAPQPSSGTAAAVTNGIIFISAARAAATYTSDEIYNPGSKGARIYVDVTNANGGSLVIKIQTRDPNSDNWVDLTGATSSVATPWASNQTRTLTVYPGLTVAAGNATTNTDTSNFVSVSWRVVVTVSTATMTFSVGGEYLI